MNAIFRILKFCNSLVPKDEKLVVFRSKPDFSDSCIMVFNAMKNNPKFYDYKMVWITTHSHIKVFQGAKCYPNKSLASLWVYFRAKYTFSTHGLYGGLSANNQVKVELWHGMPLKSLSAYSADSTQKVKFDKEMHDFSYTLATSPFYKGMMAKCFSMKEEDVLVLGLPRNDLLMHPDNSLNKLNIKNAHKYICWLPTYRDPVKVIERGRVVDQGKHYELGIPLLNNENIIQIDHFIKKMDVSLIIKIHCNQKFDINKIPSTSNIRILTNEDLSKCDVLLYNLLACSDALITDYSSVYVDYLATDKPIGFVVDDIKEYGKDRGFVFENPLDYMPGMKINNIDTLIDFIKSVSKGKDEFKDTRESARPKLNVFTDDKNTQRLIDFVFGSDKSDKK